MNLSESGMQDWYVCRVSAMLKEDCISFSRGKVIFLNYNNIFINEMQCMSDARNITFNKLFGSKLPPFSGIRKTEAVMILNDNER
jgi:hypothetical protein